MKIIRLLSSVLCVSLFIQVNIYAATCDDVRQLYGKSPLDTQEYHDMIDYVDTLGEIKDKKEIAANMVNAQSRLDNIFNRYQEISDEKDGLIIDITEAMHYDRDVIAIIGKTRELVSVNDKLEQIHLVSDVEDVSIESSNYNELNAKIGNSREYINDNYNIGHLKTGWPVHTTSELEILNGYGCEGSETGVYLNAKDAREIISMFTGLVTKVEESETYGKWIEVQSGKGLKVTYSGLRDLHVKLGQRVEAGDIIAGGCDDSDSLYVEMILDDEYVNPLLVMGAEGVKANNDWIYKNVGVSDMSKLLNMSLYDYTPIERLYDTNYMK